MMMLLFHHHHRCLQLQQLVFSRIRQRQQQRRCSSSSSSSSSHWTVSFSGAGHLLSYHLGVIKVLLEKKQNLHIGGVVGSSAGAIAASILALIPHRLDEFTQKFFNNRGLALSTFKTMLKEEEYEYQLKSTRSTNNDKIKTTTTTTSQLRQPMMKLGIATTRCKDTSLKVFQFDITSYDDDAPITNTNTNTNTSACVDDILLAIEASCKIPLSFHPFDIIHNKNKNKHLSYPNEEGILMFDGEYYVDGGIAAPIPLFLEEDEEGDLDLEEGEGDPDDVVVATTRRRRNRHNIIVSPISGGLGDRGAWSLENKNNTLIEIRPNDNTFTLPGGDWKVGTHSSLSSSTEVASFHNIRPSIQNLRAMITSMGLVNPGILEDWYKMGIDDAGRNLSLLSDCQF